MFISAEHLNKTIRLPQQDLVILDDVNLDIKDNETLAIMGISGSGKSTLLGLLAGLDLPSQGRVIFEGVDFNTLSEDRRAQIRAEKIGFVFQNFLLIQTLTALENVMLPLELKGEKNCEARARDLLKDLGLKNRTQHYPRELSGGEQQRVAIARAFAIRPRVMFVDEPTANLDHVTATQIIQLLFEMNQHYHTTLVCVTHDKMIADRCNQVKILEAGQLK